MRRFRPKLFTQLSIILLLFVLALQLMTVWIDYLDTTHFTRSWARDEGPRQLAQSLAVLERQPKARRPEVARALSIPGRHLFVRPVAGLHPTDERDPEAEELVKGWLKSVGLNAAEVRVAERLFREMPNGPPPGIATERPKLLAIGAPPRMALPRALDFIPPWVSGDWSSLDRRGDIPASADPETGPPRTPPDKRPPDIPLPQMRTTVAEVYTVAVRLEGDQNWTTQYTLYIPPPWNASITKLAFTFTGSLVLVIFALFLGRRIMAPLTELSISAERLGRGDKGENVAERGPSDIRDTIIVFNQMNRRVSQSVDYQIGLLRSLGHDLKGPLASIKCLVEHVDPEETRERIGVRLDRVQSIVESIMGFSRAVMRDGDLERTDLSALIESIADEQADMGAEVSVEAPRRLILPCRLNALERCLRNLVENAIKYGGSAEVLLQVEDQLARVLVKDRGPGLPPDQLEVVFQPFYRLGTDVSGTGLGLAIARTIAIDHGGNVELRNRRGGGLVAELSLPLSRV